MSKSIYRVLAAAGLSLAATALPLSGSASADDVYVGGPCYSSAGYAAGSFGTDGAVTYDRDGRGGDRYDDRGRGDDRGGKGDGRDGRGGDRYDGRGGKGDGGHGGHGGGNGWDGGWSDRNGGNGGRGEHGEDGGNGLRSLGGGSGDWELAWNRGGPDCNSYNIHELNEDDGILGNLF